MNKKHSEPLFHITKRKDISAKTAWAIRIAAIILALVACGILTTCITKLNPISVYATYIQGVFGSARKTWVTLQSMSILLIISLALTPAFMMKFWNIGGEGQVLIGGLGAASCMILLDGKLPNAVIILLMIVCSILAGALWALIPAVCKAIWNTNETLSTLMMNYIATQLVAYFTVLWEVPKGSGKIGVINQDSNAGWLPELGNKYALAIVVSLIITVLLFVYLKYTKQGYEITVVGESTNTARYVGISVKKVIIRTMMLSGGLCGLAGLLLVGGINHTITTTITDGQGFTGVMVSWLAKFNPFGMIATSFLIIFMDRGAGEIATEYGLNQSFADILTGVILFFIIGCEFFIRYKINLKEVHAKEDK